MMRIRDFAEPIIKRERPYSRYLYLLSLLIIIILIQHLNTNLNQQIWWYCYLFTGGLVPIFLFAYFVYPSLEKSNRVNSIVKYVLEENWQAEFFSQKHSHISDRELQTDLEFITKTAKQAGRVFNAHLSGYNHIIPVIMLVSIVLIGNFIIFSYVEPLWGALGDFNDEILNIPTSIFYGFIGSNLFVLYSIVRRFRSIDITPIMILGMSYQIVLGTTTAYILTSLTTDYADEFIAFCVGFVPFSDLAKWFTSTAKNKLDQKPMQLASDEVLLKKDKEKLYHLAGIAIEDCERLREEGIFTIHDLALSNPITLYLITPFKLSQLIEWINQAYLHTFIGGESIENLSAMGIHGAMGVRTVSREIMENNESQGELDIFLEKLAEKTGEDTYTMNCLVNRFISDPRVMLLEALWLEFGTE